MCWEIVEVVIPVLGAHNSVMPTVDESSVFSPSASSSFNPNPVPSFDQEMSPLESGEAEPPQIRRPLMSPSDAERRRHETSHLPFREWCETLCAWTRSCDASFLSSKDEEPKSLSLWCSWITRT